MEIIKSNTRRVDMKNKILVQEQEVLIIKNDYISLTDIAKSKNSEEPKDVVKNWLRNKNEAGLNSFTLSPKEWQENNSDKKGNMRDYTSVEQLVVLANLETLNAEFIKQKIKPQDKLEKLNIIAIEQLELLLKYSIGKINEK